MKFHSCQVQFTLRQKFVEFEMELRSRMKTYPNLSFVNYLSLSITYHPTSTHFPLSSSADHTPFQSPINPRTKPYILINPMKFWETTPAVLNCYDQYLEDATWRRAKGNDNIIGCTEVVSVSTLCSRCSILALSLYTMTCLSYGLQPVSSCLSYTYSIDTILYPYALPLIHLPYSHLKSLP